MQLHTCSLTNTLVFRLNEAVPDRVHLPDCWVIFRLYDRSPNAETFRLLYAVLWKIRESPKAAK
jgi:hypothetical protein